MVQKSRLSLGLKQNLSVALPVAMVTITGHQGPQPCSAVMEFRSVVLMICSVQSVKWTSGTVLVHRPFNWPPRFSSSSCVQRTSLRSRQTLPGGRAVAAVAVCKQLLEFHNKSLCLTFESGWCENVLIGSEAETRRAQTGSDQQGAQPARCQHGVHKGLCCLSNNHFIHLEGWGWLA